MNKSTRLLRIIVFLITLFSGSLTSTNNFTSVSAAIPETIQNIDIAPSSDISETDSDSSSINLAQEDNSLLIFIPAGPFAMGGKAGDINALDDEFPLHMVSLSAFWIYRTEVTNRMYSDCVAARKCTPPMVEQGLSTFTNPKYADFPVVGVDWNNASTYCKFAGARLPTEAEWEKAALGTDGRIYPWDGEAPSCDLNNMKGCKSDLPYTDKVGLHGSGISPYGASDMAGNAREWVQDWYLNNYYSLSPGWDPQGPITGTKKIIRGGGFNDKLENVRGTARFSAMPNTNLVDVGFRCVPENITSGSAPFCMATYPPFCKSPDKTPCVGTTEIKGPDTPVVTQVDCTLGDKTNIYVTTNFPSVDQITLKVDKNPYYSCQPNTGYPGRVICTGPMPSQGNMVDMQICQGTGTTSTTQNGGGIVPGLVGAQKTSSDNTNLTPLPSLGNFLVSVGQATVGLCPVGMLPNKQGGCDAVVEDKCPAGWNWRAQLRRCVPGGSRNCPSGTTYSLADVIPYCQPNSDVCPVGYSLLSIDGKKTCAPFKETGQCPQGYKYNNDTNCCVSIPANNQGCDAGSYFNSTYNKCIPISSDGCSYGQHFDYNKGCVDDFQPDGTAILTKNPDKVKNTCPWPLVDDGSNRCTFAPDYKPTGPDYRSVQQCLPGDTLQGGICEPESIVGQKVDCGPYGQYISALGKCGLKSSDGCLPGYYKDKNTQKCRATTGAGSPCPYGYGFNPSTGCCTTLPGNQGSSCPAYPGVSQVVLPASSVKGEKTFWGSEISNFMRLANYNPLAGLCMPGKGQPCPPGYILREDKCTIISWDPANCLEGSIADSINRVCRPSTAGKCPVNMTFDSSDNSCKLNPVISQALCPIGSNEVDGRCYPDDGKTCPLGTNDGMVINGKITCNVTKTPQGSAGFCDHKTQYLDEELRICSTRNSECCRPGYAFDLSKKQCIPLVVNTTAPVGVTCPFGTQWSTKDNGCVSLGGSIASLACYSIRASIPICNGLCPDPMVWDGHACIQSHDRPVLNTNCGQWNNLDACNMYNCNWNLNTEKCIPRCNQWKTKSKCEEKECWWDTETVSCTVK